MLGMQNAFQIHFTPAFKELTFVVMRSLNNNAVYVVAIK